MRGGDRQAQSNGLDVLTISRRLGHSSPTITLAICGHLFPQTDDRAAQIMPVDFVNNDKGVTGIYARWHMFEEKREAVMAIEAASLPLVAAR
jgi:hypothetical protein